MIEFTTSQIADRLGVPEHRVQNILRFHRDIKPARRVGLIRVFDQAAFDRVAAEVRRLDARRAGGAVHVA